MLLKKISLYNFRQFKDLHEIEFATNAEKNVTIVMAEGGVGKTTLAQAFQWAMYRKVDFDDQTVLNLKVRRDMAVGDEERAEVKLIIEHKNIEYEIKTKQGFRKESTGELKIFPTETSISYTTISGQVDFIKQEKVISTINSILPEPLSRYFFFDGERIEKMNYEIKNQKGGEFATAVKNLLGLTALLNMIDHFNGRSGDSVIGRYNKEIDENGGQRAKDLRETINNSNERVSENELRLEEIERDLSGYRRNIEDVKTKLISYADIEKAQQTLNRLEEDIKRDEKRKNELTKSLFQYFSNESKKYFSNLLIKDVLEELNNTGNIDKGIPDVRNTTIKFLMKRGKCICGADLSDPTNEACRELIELSHSVPPESIGSSINNFCKECNIRFKSGQSFYSVALEKIKEIRNISNDIEEKNNQKSEIDISLLKNTNGKIADMKRQQQDWEREVIRLSNERDDINRSFGALENTIRNSENELTKITKIDEKNKIVGLRKKYAEAIYNMIKRTYDFKEQEVRQKLEKEMNDMFGRIYAGDMSIRIDEKYNIYTYINELDDNNSNVDRSTSQGYSVIFAFIVAVIKLSKQKNNDDEDDLVSNEVFPLVMDAPLSAFDIRRINNICNVIPEIARQVIIFIKDTDGKIAKENMSNRIGLEYQLKIRDDKSLVDTYIEKRGEF